MTMVATTPVTIEYLMLEVVDHQPGAWCPRCLLPSASVITLASQVRVNGRVSPMRLSTGLRCLDGHGWIPDDADH